MSVLQRTDDKRRTNASQAEKTVRAMYAELPAADKEVGESQFRRNLTAGMPPRIAGLRRANQPFSGGYLYRITRLTDEKSYIGATTIPGKFERWDGHVSDARRGRGSKGSLEEAIREADFDVRKFRVEVLARSGHDRPFIEVNPLDKSESTRAEIGRMACCYVDPKSLRDAEKALIRRHETKAPSGFNLDNGGSIGSQHNAVSICVDEIDYPSLTAACVAHNVERTKFLYRVCNGWSNKQALDLEPPPIRTYLRLHRVRGRSYYGDAALARAFGLKRATVVSRLRRGWTSEQAAGVSAPPGRATRKKGGPELKINYRALSAATGVPASTIRHRVVDQGLSIECAKKYGKRNGGHPSRFTHRGTRYIFPSLRRAAAHFGVKYGTAKRRRRRGASIKQALGLVPIQSRRRRRPTSAGRSKPRAKPIQFMNVNYSSIADAARQHGCVNQGDINYFCGLIREGKSEVDILARIRRRLGRHNSPTA